MGTHYASDLTDEQWEEVRPLIPPAKPGGRPRTVDMRRVLDAIFYVLHTGCQWKMLPHDLPAKSTVYDYYRQFVRDGTWRKIHDALRARVRKKEGHYIGPRAIIIDSQTVKTTEKGGRAATMRRSVSLVGSGR